MWSRLWLCFATGLQCLGLLPSPTQLSGLTTPAWSQHSSPVLLTHGNNLHSSSAQLCLAAPSPYASTAHPPSIFFSLSHCCSLRYFHAPHLYHLGTVGVQNVPNVCKCTHIPDSHTFVPNLLPLIFSLEELQDIAYCLLLLLIRHFSKMATLNIYSKHSKNIGSGLNCSHVAEPSRSVTIPARVRNRGLCLSCCSLAYGTVQTAALPACLAAC